MICWTSWVTTHPRMKAPTTIKTLPSRTSNWLFLPIRDGSDLKVLAMREDAGKKKMKKAAKHPRNLITFPMSGMKMAQIKERPNQIMTITTRWTMFWESGSTWYPKLKKIDVQNHGNIGCRVVTSGIQN